MNERIRVRVDRDECISCGVCWSICPDIFEENPDYGLTQIVETHRVDGDPGTGEVPAGLEDCSSLAKGLNLRKASCRCRRIPHPLRKDCERERTDQAAR